MNRSRLQIENLKHLLLHSSVPTHMDDRERRLIELLAGTFMNSRFIQSVTIYLDANQELEDMRAAYNETRSAFNTIQHELKERTDMLDIVRDRVRLLELQNESSIAERRTIDIALVDAQNER